MDLSIELKSIIDKFGINILANPNFTNILADYHITNQYPFVAPIIKDVLANYGDKIVAQFTEKDSNILKATLIHCRNKYISDAIYNKENLTLVIDSLACAVGIYLPSIDSQSKNTNESQHKNNQYEQKTSSQEPIDNSGLRRGSRWHPSTTDDKGGVHRNVLGTTTYESFQDSSRDSNYIPDITSIKKQAQYRSAPKNTYGSKQGKSRKSSSRSSNFDSSDNSNKPGCNSWSFWFSKSGCITVFIILAFIGLIQQCSSKCSSNHESANSSTNNEETINTPKIPSIAIPTAFVDTVRDTNGIIEDIKIGESKKDVVLELSPDTLFLKSKYEIMAPTIALCFDSEIFNKEEQEHQREHLYYFQLLKHDDKALYPFIYGIEKSKFTKVENEQGINERTDKIFLSGTQPLRNIVILYPPKDKLPKNQIEYLSKKTGDILLMQAYSDYEEGEIRVNNSIEYKNFDDDTRILLFDYFATLTK